MLLLLFSCMFVASSVLATVLFSRHSSVHTLSIPSSRQISVRELFSVSKLYLAVVLALHDSDVYYQLRGGH
ncbi:hypothetical protein EDD16DRAFT_1245999 [Pisolithus croceorrhizus]|nr:hypothetical protein EDD16DRAFT_1245999 [Pisolithus croceorrhizus]KAI6111397.1 hypothetical protein F5141DRAFT_779294 [Pisolithus sp. B1]